MENTLKKNYKRKKTFTKLLHAIQKNKINKVIEEKNHFISNLFSFFTFYMKKKFKNFDILYKNFTREKIFFKSFTAKTVFVSHQGEKMNFQTGL